MEGSRKIIYLLSHTFFEPENLLLALSFFTLFFFVKHEENISSYTQAGIYYTQGWKSHKKLFLIVGCASHSLIYCHWEKFIDFLLQPTIQQTCVCFSFPHHSHSILVCTFSCFTLNWRALMLFLPSKNCEKLFCRSL